MIRLEITFSLCDMFGIRDNGRDVTHGIRIKGGEGGEEGASRCVLSECEADDVLAEHRVVVILIHQTQLHPGLSHVFLPPPPCLTLQYWITSIIELFILPRKKREKK